MAGGLKITAYLERAQIDRVVPFENRVELGMDRLYTDVNLRDILDSSNIFSQDGDDIQIFSVLDIRQNVVDIKGSVTRAGRYDLGDSLRVSQLVDKAGGLLGDAYMERADIIRVNDDFSELLLKLNLVDVLNGDPSADIILQGMDRVQIYSKTEMMLKPYVTLAGHVKFPGRYSKQENMTLYDLLFKGGGFLDKEYKKLTFLPRAELIRSGESNNDKEIIPFNLGEVLEKRGIFDLPLLSDDRVVVYSEKEIKGDKRYVNISGHVKRPGAYELFEKNMTAYDLLFKAGGFDDILFKAQTFLSRADLIRFDEDRLTKSIFPFNLENVMENKDSDANFILLPGDEIRVYSQLVFNAKQRVTINGVVRKPGQYDLKKDMNLKDLILEAGGTNPNVFRSRVEIARINPLNSKLDEFAEIIVINLDEKFSVSSKKSSSDISRNDPGAFKLEPYDLITIRPDPFFNFQKQINISGEVLYPGQYTILSSEEKITDIIEELEDYYQMPILKRVNTTGRGKN